MSVGGKKCEKQPCKPQDETRRMEGGGALSAWTEQSLERPGWSRETGWGGRSSGAETSWTDPKPLFPISLLHVGWGGRGSGNEGVQPERKGVVGELFTFFFFLMIKINVKWQEIKLIFPQTDSVFSVIIIGEWSPCLHLTPWAFLSYFLSLSSRVTGVRIAGIVSGRRLRSTHHKTKRNVNTLHLSFLYRSYLLDQKYCS